MTHLPASPAPSSQSRHRASGGHTLFRPASQGLAARSQAPPGGRSGQHPRHCRSSSLPSSNSPIAPRRRLCARNSRSRSKLRRARAPNWRSPPDEQPPQADQAQVAAGAARRGPGAARRHPRAPRPRQGSGRDADPRRRPEAPHARPVRHHARQPGAGAQRSEAQRHPLAGRRVAAANPSSRPARSIARGRARPDGLDRLRAPPRPAAGRRRSPGPGQAEGRPRIGSARMPGRS